LAVHNEGKIGCTIVTGFTEDDSSGTEQPATTLPSCDWRKTWPGEIEEWHPKVVFMLWGPWDTGDHMVNGRWLRIGTPEWTSYYDDQLTQMVRLLSSEGARVVIGTAPQFHRTPTATLPNPTYDNPRRLATLNAELTGFAARNSAVDVFDLASFVQPSDFGSDGVHFSPQGSSRLAAFVDPALNELANPSASIAPPPGLILTSNGPTQPGPRAS
jgi:hypothetical protein